MSEPIVIVDAGTGNLRSVAKAIEAVGGRAVVTRDPDAIRRAHKVIVPGQGAFAGFMAELCETGAEAALREVIADGRPYLGICLGLQILFDESEEHGKTTGLGILPGKVKRFDPRGAEGPGSSLTREKVPHMGWNAIIKTTLGKRDPLLHGVDDGECVYFVHSYYAAPADDTCVALTARHGIEFCAAVRKDQVFGCQFHPEKSQKSGLALLAAFAEMRGAP